MTQDLTGGYCSRCNTVWAAPGICNCKDKITYINDEGGFPHPTFHCSVCWEATEGFSLCLRCNPQRYEVVGTEDSLSGTAINAAQSNVYAKEVWNEAIEAAAKHLDSVSDYPNYVGEQIRKLKK